MRSRSSIGGTLDMSAYARLARQDRTTEAGALVAEIRRLARTGLKPRDISEALRVHVDQVNAVLARDEVRA